MAGKAAGNKTVPTREDVGAFIAGIPDEKRRSEAQLLVEVMAATTGEPPVMWGPAIVGFGSRRLTYESGRQVDVPRVGFSPRKAQSVVYVSGDFDEYRDLLPRLGRHSLGKACLYLKDPAEADQDALRELVDRCYRWEQD